MSNLIMETRMDTLLKKKDPHKLRNVSIIAHVDHGKTTLTDNLLAEVGLINSALAGEQLATDHFSVEKERGITINKTNVSFIYQDRIFTLSDSPGHADFNAEVVKCLRASDGAILVVDVNEGLKTQTETVLAQALNQNLKIVLYLNKIDRLIDDMYLSSKQIYQKIQTTIARINELVYALSNSEQKEYFKFSENVAFGSALKKWGTSYTDLKESNRSFKQIIEGVKEKKDLSKDFNLAKTLLGLCIRKIPSPVQAQYERLKGLYFEKDFEEEFKAQKTEVLEGRLDTEFNALVTDINYDKFSGFLATIKVVSGFYNKGMPLSYIRGDKKAELKPPTNVSIQMIKKQHMIGSCFSGMIVVLHGALKLEVGDFITSNTTAEVNFKYPTLKYTRIPVVCVSIMPEVSSELKKMISCMHSIVLEDPSLKFEYVQQTGQFLLYGVGLLHLEITIKKLQLIYNLKVKASPPSIDYSETLNEGIKTQIVSVRTPNKHNDFNLYLFKLPKQLEERLHKKEISAKSLTKVCELYFPKPFAKCATKILEHGNLYFENTKGCEFLEDVKQNISKSLELALEKGYKLEKPIKGVGVVLTFAKIHEDPLHRGINQMRSAFRAALDKIFLKTPLTLVEPIMQLDIEAPYLYSESLNTEIIANRRGSFQYSEGSKIPGYFRSTYHAPLAELLTFSTTINSLSEGRALYNLNHFGFQSVPKQIIEKKDLYNEKDQKKIKKT